MFKDSFVTICRAHHLASGTLRSYKSWITRFQRLNISPAEFLSGLSPQSFRQARAALSFAGVALGDLSNIKHSTAGPRVVDVPTDALARKIVGADHGNVGLILKIIYETGRRPASVLKDNQFKDIDNNAVYTGMMRIRTKLGLKRNYTSKSIRYAGIRRIALRDGFLAAHKALGVKDTTITESVLGNKIVSLLPRAPSPI